MIKKTDRQPAAFAPSPKKQKKWDRIIGAFLSGDMDRLQTVQRAGARGRILEVLARQVFDAMGVDYEREPIFEHVTPIGTCFL